MPSIVIRERDLTSAGNLEVTTNAVYIPGYANIGPVNTPILCETLADFQATFGSEPYMFRTAHDWPTDFTTNAVASNMGKFYEKGEREKSYIMAAELLRLGTPVVYERVSNSETQYKLLSTSTTYSNPVIKTATELWTSTTGIRKVDVNGEGLSPVTNTGDIWITAESVMPGRAAADIYFTLENNKVEYKD